MRSKWPDFLFAVGVRFFVGALLGLLASIPIIFFAGSRGGRRRSVLVESVQNGRHAFLVWWCVVWALAGGLMAVFSIPKWQTPWHKPKRLNLEEGDDDVHIV